MAHTLIARFGALVGIVCASLAAPVFAASIAEPAKDRYPGNIVLKVDVSDIERKIYQVQETIPVAPGPLTLLFPQWLPGTHSPMGNIAGLSGLEFTANGKAVPWVRDTVNMYAFHVQVPSGATTLQASFQYLSANTSAQGRVLVTQDLLNLQWNSVLLYPAGYHSNGITFEPSVRFPEGWKFAVALETAWSDAQIARFKPVALTDLIDSPFYAGRYFKRWDITPDKGAPVYLDVVADNAESLAADEKLIQPHRQLIEQSYKVFGRPPYAHYDFLIAVSEVFGGTGGLEHRQSTEIGTGAGYFTKWATTPHQRPVVPHEFAHAWNGKFKRPADLTTRNYNEPMQNTLLWVYEGQTTYWGDILSARASLISQVDAREMIARTAAESDKRAGRTWRNLQDTTNEPIMGWRAGRAWPSWQRSADYYGEGSLIWLEADQLLRELSNGRRSLDDFARAFFVVPADNFTIQTYTFDDVVTTLNGVAAYDWAAFLRARLDSVRADDPLDPFAKSGWKLVYTDKPNIYGEAASKGRNQADFAYSLGVTLNRADQISEVEWGSPAFEAKLAPGSTLVAVNGRAYKPELLAQAVVAAKVEGKVELLVKTDDRYRTVALSYRGGLRYPHLERIEGTPDRLSAVLATVK